MKALIIILALVFVTFFGLLIYGSNRNETPKEECERMPPSFQSKDGPSEDEMNDWCPPSIARATKGLQARFAPDLKLKQEATLRSAFPEARFPVGSSDKKVRAAHIKLVSGDAAILSDGDKGKLCLCRPGAAMDTLLSSGDCGERWKSDHRKNAKQGQQNICQASEVEGILPFDENGGAVVLKAQPSATVSIH